MLKTTLTRSKGFHSATPGFQRAYQPKPPVDLPKSRWGRSSPPRSRDLAGLFRSASPRGARGARAQAWQRCLILENVAKRRSLLETHHTKKPRISANGHPQVVHGRKLQLCEDGLPQSWSKPVQPSNMTSGEPNSATDRGEAPQPISERTEAPRRAFVSSDTSFFLCERNLRTPLREGVFCRTRKHPNSTSDDFRSEPRFPRVLRSIFSPSHLECSNATFPPTDRVGRTRPQER